MHKYLRAVGFSDVNTKSKLQVLIGQAVKNAEERSFSTYGEDTLLAEYNLEVAPGIGVTVCGEMDENDRFLYDYSFPYLRPGCISTQDNTTIERHMDKISYAGVCDDNRVGITIIFYVQNRIDYLKNFDSYYRANKNIAVSLSGLSIDGMIMMPVDKSTCTTAQEKAKKKKRNSLVEAARNGDENAIETLTLDDMDLYSNISRKIKYNDLYSLVETYFMPYGVECDLYSVMGEIEDVEELMNAYTRDIVYKLSIVCNEIPLTVCINKADLFGEPQAGRRFKGTIWLQGKISEVK